MDILVFFLFWIAPESRQVVLSLSFIRILLNQEANNQIAVCAYGQGGYDEMIQYLDETKSQFGYFRVIAIDSSSEFTSKRAKFVFFSYVGPKVSLMYRAKVSILVSGVHRLFNVFDFKDWNHLL